jgi:hypothetical protein
MICSKRSFAVVSMVFAALLSLSTGTLNARDADLASRTFAAAQTAKTPMHQCLSYTISRLLFPEPDTLLRMPGRLPGLRPVHL